MKNHTEVIKMMLAEKLLDTLMEGAEPLPDTYPQVSVPATLEDLQNLFDFFNKEYFNNEIGKCRLKFAPLAKRFNGKAHVKYGDGYAIKDMLITIGTMIKKDPKNVVDVMAHEMIHAWQYTMNARHNTGKYCELTWAEAFASKDKHTWGHNDYFFDWVAKMNRDGFNVTEVGGMDSEIEIEKPYYGITLDLGGGQHVIVYSDKNPEKNIQEIMETIIERVGSGSFKDYTVFKTEDSIILQCNRLTKSWALPKNVMNIRFPSSAVDTILNSKLTKIISTNSVDSVDGLDLVASAGIRPEIVQTLARMASHKNNSFYGYLNAAIFHAFPAWGRIAGNKLNSQEKQFKGETIPDDLTTEEAQFIYDNWFKISDIDVKRSSDVKYFASSLHYAAALKRKLSPNDIKSNVGYYEGNYKGRFDRDKFCQIVFDVSWKQADKSNNKYSKSDVTRDMYLADVKELLSGTELESWFAKIK